MNKTAKEAEEFIKDLVKNDFKDVDVLIAPPFTSLDAVKRNSNGKIYVGSHGMIC